MDYFEAVSKRGSYRGAFTSAPVPQEDLEKILEAGARAPSGYNFQTTSFVVVTDDELRKALSDMMPSEATKSAPVILVLVSAFHAAENGLSFEIEDYAAAAENILLAITSLGYAGVWMDGRMKLDDNEARVRKLLSVPDSLHVRTIIPFGKPLENVTQKEKLPLCQRIVRNHF